MQKRSEFSAVGCVLLLFLFAFGTAAIGLGLDMLGLLPPSGFVRE